MGYRLSKITTRTGDDGSTGLASGERVQKNSPRIIAIGAVDELNSWIGLVLAQELPDEVRGCLSEIQHQLFEAGAELSLPGQSRVSERHVSELENAVERFNQRLNPLREFVLPGGSTAGAMCHVARTVCRRTETHLLALRGAEPAQTGFLIPYLNRLSDLLFVVARLLNKENKVAETLWKNT